MAFPALQWSIHGTPEQVSALIDRDMAATDQHTVIGKTRLTPQWLVHATPFIFLGVPYAEIAWAYKKVVTRRALYGLIPVGKNYFLAVNTRNGKSHSVANLKEPQIDQILHEIAGRAPVGHRRLRRPGKRDVDQAAR